MAEGLTQFLPLAKRVQMCKTTKDALNRQALAIRSEITQLEVDITELRRPAGELNDELRSSVWDTPASSNSRCKNNGYVLNRSGIPASQLSEGEISRCNRFIVLPEIAE